MYICRARITLLFLIILLLGLHPLVAAAEFNVGVKAFSNQNYEKAYEMFLPLAEKGHPGAMFGLGLLYRNGLGVQKSSSKAIQYYEAAAKKGYAKAQYNLAVSLLSIKGKEKEALTWLKLAAQHNIIRAQYHLGMFYWNGFHNLSYDVVQAYVWLDIAASNGFKPAQVKLKKIKLQIPDKQLRMARKLADKWRPKKRKSLKNSIEIAEMQNSCVRMNLDLDVAIDNIQSNSKEFLGCLPQKDLFDDCTSNLVRLVNAYKEYKTILKEEWWGCTN